MTTREKVLVHITSRLSRMCVHDLATDLLCSRIYLNKINFTLYFVYYL